MAREAIEAVRQAELNAANVEKQAVEKRDEILIKAQQEAKDIYSAMEKETLAKVKLDLEQVLHQGEAVTEAAVRSAEKEIARLGESLKAREQEAIELVISEIV